MFEKLRIKVSNKREITFDEFMDATDGEWSSSGGEYEPERIKKICFKSLKYDYFIYEDDEGNHCLLRNEI